MTTLSFYRKVIEETGQRNRDRPGGRSTPLLPVIARATARQRHPITHLMVCTLRFPGDFIRGGKLVPVRTR
jgi:hypothetical protein